MLGLMSNPSIRTGAAAFPASARLKPPIPMPQSKTRPPSRREFKALSASRRSKRSS